MRNLLLILVCLFALNQTYSADLLLKAGANYSWFANEGGTSEPKAAVGIGLQFPLDSSSPIRFCVDALYVGEMMTLRDKSWQGHTPQWDECDVMSGDLYIHYDYFKLPLYISSTLFRRKNLTAVFDVGLGLNCTIGSRSRGGNYSNTQERCEYDYERVNSDQDPKHPTELLVGTALYYKNIGMNLTYSRTIKKTDQLFGLKIQDNIHSIRMMLILKMNDSAN